MDPETDPSFDPDPECLFPWLDGGLRVLGMAGAFFAAVALVVGLVGGTADTTYPAVGTLVGLAISCALGRVLIRIATELFEIRRRLSR